MADVFTRRHEPGKASEALGRGRSGESRSSCTTKSIDRSRRSLSLRTRLAADGPRPAGDSSSRRGALLLAHLPCPAMTTRRRYRRDHSGAAANSFVPERGARSRHRPFECDGGRKAVHETGHRHGCSRRDGRPCPTARTPNSTSKRGTGIRKARGAIPAGKGYFTGEHDAGQADPAFVRLSPAASRRHPQRRDGFESAIRA